MKVKTKYLCLIGLMAVSLGLLILTYVGYAGAARDLEIAQKNRFDSYLLADELRQSSDDLTRLARTYVVTGDTRYEQQYFDILDIRGGKKPRPVDYNRIYWDFVAATGQKPRPDGETIALLDMMKKAGFTEAEFGKLEEAAANSDGLVNLEVQAMNAVKGLFADSTGKYTVKGAPDFELARNLMHSREYHNFKAQIVTPIDAFYVMLDQRTGGAVLSAQQTAGIYNYVMMGTIALMVVAIGISAWVVLAKILSPIVELRGSMLGLANGDKSVTIPSVARRDEIGEMAQTVQVFKENMTEADRLRAEQEAANRNQLDRAGKLAQAVADFDQMIGDVVSGISNAASNMQGTAQSLSGTAERTTQQSNLVASASEQMAHNVQTVAAATEELTTSIQEIGTQVTESSRIVSGAVTQSAATNAKVGSLAEAARRIGDVVTLINEIASQTNLLALNATIEAARAGEAGKGFAVVASEVKNLAGQTAKATDEIGGQIRAIQEATQSSAEAIHEITQTINRVSEISTTIASAVEEQGAATQEISRSVQQAASGTTEVSTNIVSVTEASQQTSSGAATVLAAATELSSNGERLKREVDSFLKTVRSL